MGKLVMIVISDADKGQFGGSCNRRLPQPFAPWDGEYDKTWYDVQTPDGSVIKHCWPNAGKMNAVDGSGREWTVDSGIKVRLSANHPLDEVQTRPVRVERKPDPIAIKEMRMPDEVVPEVATNRRVRRAYAAGTPKKRLFKGWRV